jgi:hypothetical protein
VHGQAEQIGIRDLIVSCEPEVPDGFMGWQIVSPKTMRWMVDVEC